ncbi:MAG: hypothetical protein LBS54_04505 [Dysgonamonadaceae bacterium]|jgi:hypothetical protein|nr:hypothetical protein [Dysgonamonadaceae bacterium]
MRRNTESGISTYVGNFDQLIGVCKGFGPDYNPVPDYLKIAALQAQSVHIKSAVNDTDIALSNAISAEGKRHDLFALLAPRATRVLAAATILGLPESIIVHIKEIVRKIRGKRSKPIEPEQGQENETPKKHISVSQKSFNEQIEHLHQLVTLVASQPLYKPAENDLTIDALRKLQADMGIANDAAVEANRILDEAREKRNELLYAPGSGMMDTALAVKEYVKAAFGAPTWCYLEVKKIPFRNR